MSEQGGASDGVLGRLRTHELISKARVDLLADTALRSPHQ
jgi:hypothetical protein